MGRFPHALIMQGRQGGGKRIFSSLLTQSLLCEERLQNSLPCGKCRSCRLFIAGSHPDLRWVEPEEEGKGIRVHQVRALMEFVVLKSARGGFKVAIINPAEGMNRYTANSLLKTLEEPPDDTLLILVSHAPNLLPQTVRSRCQRIVFHMPPLSQSIPWVSERISTNTGNPELLLRLANGSPFRALELGEENAVEGRDRICADIVELVQGKVDPISVADGWQKLELSRLAYWMDGLVTDLIRLKHTASPPVMINHDLRGDLQGLSQRLDFKLLFNLHDQCLEACRVVEQHLNLNPQCVLEEMAMTWHVSTGR